jgi:dTMP kinase
VSEQVGRLREPGGSVGSVLRIRDFRRLWVGLGLSSLGDWLGLLALTAMASQFADSYAAQNYAIAAVLFLRVLPPLVIGPLAGYVADRLDRRTVLVWGDVARGLLFASIPLVGTLWWVFVVTVLVETVSTIWGPAKDATVPNLVPAERLEAANQLSLTTTYGSALPAAAAFAGLAFVDRVHPQAFGWLERGAEDVALYLDAATFLVSAVVISRLRDIPRGPADTERTGLLRVMVDGWTYVARTPLVRGLVVGIVGAFMAGGVVVALARTFVADLRGGDSGYGLLFGAVFLGLGLGMWRGPGLLGSVPRTRVFGIALTACGLLLFPVALVPQLQVVIALAVAVGFCAGAAWVTGNTLLGLEVPDQLRGRTFAFVSSMMRLALALVLAVAPLAAGSIGRVELGPVDDTGEHWFSYRGAAVTILAAAVLMTAVGAASYRQMNPRARTRPGSGKEAR